MYVVYVLEDGGGKRYKGVTSDLVRRMTEHRSGQTRTTARMGELNVVYTEKYERFDEARAREVYLKTAAGRRFLKKTLGL